LRIVVEVVDGHVFDGAVGQRHVGICVGLYLKEHLQDGDDHSKGKEREEGRQQVEHHV
jgi:hypothetical protein